MHTRVQNGGEFSEPFQATHRAKHDCVLAPTMFSMMFHAMLADAFQDWEDGNQSKYRFNCKLLNLMKLQTKIIVQWEMPDKLLYADDMAKDASTERKMKEDMDQVSQACENCDLTISTQAQRL